MHPFFDLDGHHVCTESAESFRKGYCADCQDVIDLEGLCAHGTYPDGCTDCDTSNH